MALAEEIMKAAASKSLVVKINLLFLALFLVIYAALVLPPSSPYRDGATYLPRCSFMLDCHTKRIAREKLPSFLHHLHGGETTNVSVALVNIEEEEVAEWVGVGRAVSVRFERVSEGVEWKDLFPEWIDEEQENEGGGECPDIPTPELSTSGVVANLVAARVPCGAGSRRDVVRFQGHLVAAMVAARIGVRDGEGKVVVALHGKCRPMTEWFHCEDLVRREGEWWVYRVSTRELEEKIDMPVGSCNLALPLWGQGVNEEYNATKLRRPVSLIRREAYATVLHSSDAYVCGAVALAQSLSRAGTDRDLLLLHDSSIPSPALSALAASGWLLRPITRIRNPHAENGTYNEYNYTKLRLWQLLDYAKVVFVDADILVLRSLDILFSFPEMSATGNDGSIFNSGVMVIRPSACTFDTLMNMTAEVVSYNGGDQGFLNEAFVWWHRLPRRVNFLKNFWSNKTNEASLKNSLFGRSEEDPPGLYSIHYLGLKPWLCYRDYDCNWDLPALRVYASDAAHRRWWKVFDGMPVELQGFCGLSEERKRNLEWDRKMAGEMDLPGRHWKINITDPRRI